MYPMVYVYIHANFHSAISCKIELTDRQSSQPLNQNSSISQQDVQQFGVYPGPVKQLVH